MARRAPEETGILLPHEAADLMPAMSEDRIAELAADIAVRGLIVPIIIYEGLILDGRHRYEACQRADVDPRYVEWDGKGKDGKPCSPWDYVWSLNGQRRDMEESQRAAVCLKKQRRSDSWWSERRAAADAANEARAAAARAQPRADGKLAAKPEDRSGAPVPSTCAATPKPRAAKVALAAEAGVSERLATDVLALAEADPVRFEEVAQGKKSAKQAQRERKEEKREKQRQENRKKVETTASVDNLDGRFSVLVLDPPWDPGDEGDGDTYGRANGDYAVMPIDAIRDLKVCGRPVADLADKDAHIYLWITNRSLPKGFALLEAWGFRYVTCLTWGKPSYGMGNYYRGQTEHVLFGVRGSMLLKRKDVGTLLQAPRGPGGHSSKPDEFYALVESCSPGPWLSIFDRRSRKGWVMWGEGGVTRG
jgi:N6-adenosine-specific RNA methylase IME4